MKTIIGNMGRSQHLDREERLVLGSLKMQGSPRRIGLGMLMLFLLLLTAFFSACGQPLKKHHRRLNQYLQEAAHHNPGLKAQFHQYLAALEQVPQVTALPDPQFAFGYFIRPVETRVGPQQARVGLTQMFPWFGTLGARGEAASQLARANFEAFRDARNKLFYEVKKRWYQIYRNAQSIKIIQKNIDIVETFESLSTHRYATGQVDQIDVLRVQIEKEDLKTKLKNLQDDLNVSVQRFNELLDQPGQQAVEVPDSLAHRQLASPVANIRQAIVQHNPKLNKLDFKASSMRSLMTVAHKEGLPSFSLGLDYIFTGPRDMPLTANGQDAMMVRGSINIPIHRNKYRAKEQQAHLKLQSVQEMKRASQNSLRILFEQSLRDYHDARRRVELYQHIQIQRTRQALDILTDQYTTSDADFEELLRLQRKLLNYELARENAVVDQNTAVAFIEYLYGKYNMDAQKVKDRREYQ